MENIGVITNQPTLDVSSKTFEQCIKGASHFSGTLYQNICDGSQNYVANGFWDYAIGFFLFGIGILVIIAFLKSILD